MLIPRLLNLYTRFWGMSLFPMRNGSTEEGSLEMMWSFTSFLEHFIIMGVAVVVKTCNGWLLGYWDDCG